MGIEIEEKETTTLVRAKRGTAMIEDCGRKVIVVGVWSFSELKELVDAVADVRKKYHIIEREEQQEQRVKKLKKQKNETNNTNNPMGVR